MKTKNLNHLEVNSVLINNFYLKRLSTLRMDNGNFNKVLNNSLFKLLKFAINEIPYYQSAKSKINLKNCCDVFFEFPIINRKILKDHFDFFLPKKIDLSDKIPRYTSGTTGQPITIYKDELLIANYCSISLDTHFMYGWNPFNTIYILHGGGIGNISEKISTNNLYKLLKTAPPDILDIYPSYLRDIIYYLNEDDINKLNFKYICTHSEQSSVEERKQFSNIFKCPVYDDYSATEVGPIAIQCRDLNYHLQTTNLKIEILDDNYNEVPDGIAGNVVITDLSNYTMPLIRYDTGDIAIKSQKICTCRWKNLPLIEKLQGRKEDSFILQSGRVVTSGSLIGTLGIYNPKSILHWHLTQKNYKEFFLNVYVASDYVKDQISDLVLKIKLILGEDINLSIKISYDYNPSKHKRKIFKCLLK